MMNSPAPRAADAQALADATRLAAEVLAPNATAHDASGTFPLASLRAIAAAGLLGMAIARDYGGLDLAYLTQAHVFAALAEGDLTSAFIASQHQACTTLVSSSSDEAQRARWLPGLADGTLHGGNGFNFLNFPPERAPMRAEPVVGGYRWRGALPWVTAAHHADLLVAGAVLPDGLQILAAIPLRERLASNDPTISVEAPMDLVALAASDTTVVHCADHFVAAADVLLGPGPNLLKSTARGATSYVPTAMTLGHARHCLHVIEDAAAHKGGTNTTMATWLRGEIAQFDADLTAALQVSDFDQAPILRGRGNALAARAAHLALIASGGTGYRRDQLAQRLYREAGFFSVWSASGAVIPETLTHLLDFGPAHAETVG
ncbi:MAG: acyl-CoA/acyl-ACP dehydrogenase [Ktedonobacterales bacterium]|nr:acyl-CoA/acyl-ACP dehydrogenase [Ktedonobacterales bacterium]